MGRRILIGVAAVLIVAAFAFWGVTEVLVRGLFRSEPSAARVSAPGADETARILREVRVRDLADRVRSEVGKKPLTTPLLAQSLVVAREAVGVTSRGGPATAIRAGEGFAVCLTDQPVLCAVITPGVRVARVGSGADVAAAIAAS